MNVGREAPSGLLHNIGGPPRASIVWRGLGGGPLASETERIAVARDRGTWLHVQLSIGAGNPLCRRDWNSAQALLELIERGHGLSEDAAAARLVDRIEAHTRALDWPPWLLCERRWAGQMNKITFDDPLTAFVALAKSTGSLWLRQREPRLAPLHAPTLVEPGSVPMKGVRWDQCLWFPDGIPSTLVDHVAVQKRSR